MRLVARLAGAKFTLLPWSSTTSRASDGEGLFWAEFSCHVGEIMPQNRCTGWSILNTIGQFPSEAATSFQRRLGHYPNLQSGRTLAGRVYIAEQLWTWQRSVQSQIKHSGRLKDWKGSWSAVPPKSRRRKRLESNQVTGILEELQRRHPVTANVFLAHKPIGSEAAKTFGCNDRRLASKCSEES